MVVSTEIDRRIVELLIRNGRAPYAQIADEVGLSAHAVAERVHRLESRGVIRGYTALIDEGGLGRGLVAYLDVRLSPTTDPDTFERVAWSLDATRAVAFVTGQFDFVLHLACEDTADLDRIVRELRRRGGVASTETRIVMRGSDAVQRSPAAFPGTRTRVARPATRDRGTRAMESSSTT